MLIDWVAGKGNKNGGNDDFIHLFASDGNVLDKLKAISRKEEREKDTKKKDQDREYQLKIGKNRGEDLITKNINELQARNQLLDEINSISFEANTSSQMMSDKMELLKIMYNNDYTLMKETDQWKKILELSKRNEELSESRMKKRKKIEEMDDKKKKRKKSDAVVTLDE